MQSHVMDAAKDFPFYAAYIEGSFVRSVADVYTAIEVLELRDSQRDLVRFMQPAATRAFLLQIGRIDVKGSEVHPIDLWPKETLVLQLLKVFGMLFVRAHCAQQQVEVWQIMQ